MSDEIKLHIGGVEPKEGWKILNILAGPNVDIIGSCTDLSLFPDNSVDQVYASHVLEHLSRSDVYKALKEIYRVLKPKGLLKASVPDLAILCQLYLKYMGDTLEQIKVTNMIYGAHVDEYDTHHFGYDFQLLSSILGGAGFCNIAHVASLDEFDDTSTYRFNDTPISLNLIAVK